MQVRGDRHGFAFVGGFDDAVKPFGGISADGKQPDIINDDEFSARTIFATALPRESSAR